MTIYNVDVLLSLFGISTIVQIVNSTNNAIAVIRTSERRTGEEREKAPRGPFYKGTNPMDRGAWWAAVCGVAKSRTRLSDFPFTFHFHALEKEMATHSSVLAWRIPGTEEPGGLLSMGSHRVGHD